MSPAAKGVKITFKEREEQHRRQRPKATGTKSLSQSIKD